MKKKIAIFLLAIIATVAGAFGLAACGDDVVDELI